MVILVSEDSNRYAHLFLIEREYFGFNMMQIKKKKRIMGNVRVTQVYYLK
jgi:hypothetical protein